MLISQEGNLKKYKGRKSFENYVEADPINFENVFGISKVDLAYVLGDLLEKYIYLDFEILSDDYEKFQIDIYENIVTGKQIGRAHV